MNHPQGKTSELVERLKANTAPDAYERTLVQWDHIRKQIARGDRSDLPRACFESIIDDKDELLDEARSELTRLEAEVGKLRATLGAPGDLDPASGVFSPESEAGDSAPHHTKGDSQ